MKKLLPQIGLLFLLLLPLLGRAQEVQISGRVVDAKTKASIPSTSISLRNSGIGALTDEFGSFRLTSLKSFQQDTFVIINLAYERYYRVVRMDSSKEISIELVSRNLEPSGTLKTIFVCNLRSDNPEHFVNTGAELLAAIPGRQYAFFIPNEKQKQFGKLRTVSFYIGENGFPMKSFRIRLYKADGNYYSPKTDLLNERVLVVPTSSNQWFTYDLSQYKIAIPGEGYFVALEFVMPDNILSQAVIENYVPTGMMMRPAIKLKKSIVWSYIPRSSWNICSITNTLHRFDAMIKVEVDTVQ